MVIETSKIGFINHFLKSYKLRELLEKPLDVDIIYKEILKMKITIQYLRKYHK